MGQQQLILLVLGVVIVGLAVVVGIQLFESQKRKSDLDLVQTEAVRLASSAVVWRETPAIKGGGLGTNSFAGFALGPLGYDAPPILEDADTQVVAAGGHLYSVWSRTTAPTYVAVTNIEYTVQAAVFLYGSAPECLVMRTGMLNAAGGFDYSPAATPPRPAGCTW